MVKNLITVFSFFKRRRRVYTKTENHIYGIIIELLKLSNTDINSDELSGKYYLSNEDQYFKVTILSEDFVIRMTNTRDSVAEKYDKFFVEDVLRAVKEEKHRRMEVVYESIVSNIEKMAERLHNGLIETNEQETEKVRRLQTESISNKKIDF